MDPYPDTGGAAPLVRLVRGAEGWALATLQRRASLGVLAVQRAVGNRTPLDGCPCVGFAWGSPGAGHRIRAAPIGPPPRLGNDRMAVEPIRQDRQEDEIRFIKGV